MARVLVVEDVVEVQDLVAARLRENFHEVHCSTAEPRDAVQRLIAFAPDVCVVDVALPGEAGLRALRAIRALDGEVRLIACTRAGEDVNVISAIRSGASEIVSTVEALQRALPRAPRSARGSSARQMVCA